MHTSIVIATRNRRDVLLPTLVRLQRTFPGVPIIVADNGSEDGTAQAVQRLHPSVTLLELPKNYGGFARTLGAQAACSEFVAFCDDDTYWEDDALSSAERLFTRYPRLALIAARVLIEPDARVDPVTRLMQASPLPQAPDLPGQAILGFLAGNSIVRRVPFLAVGGFHRAYGIGGEEELLAIDLLEGGFGLAYIDEIVAHHAPATIGRSHALRRAHQCRNALWTAWLRRPLTDALRYSWRRLARDARDGATWAGLRAAVAGAAWIVRERRPVSKRVHSMIALLEQA